VSGPIKVLIVEDHDLFRTGLASYLGGQPDIEVIAQASGGRLGVQLALELHPDVILMDLRMPDLDGTEATRQILETRAGAKIVALTVASSDADIAAALKAGACAFLVKDSPIEDVAAAVRAAAAGVAWLSPRAAEAVLGQIRRQPVAGDADGAGAGELSAREIDVLRLLARGLENSEIAEELEISPSTAKNHVSSILAKLGLPNRIHAAIYAVRNQLD
jgi:NarL family two-component system response regulator LiaR